MTCVAALVPVRHWPALSRTSATLTPAPDAFTPARAPPPSLSSPPAGHYYNRVLVLWLGCTIWGFFTICFSLTTTVHQGIATWALNGVGLALMIPNAQSMVADYYSADSRGSAFGMMCLTSALGAMVGALYATNIGGRLGGGGAGLTAWCMLKQYPAEAKGLHRCGTDDTAVPMHSAYVTYHHAAVLNLPS